MIEKSEMPQHNRSQLSCREVYELTAVIALVREVEGVNSPSGSATKEAPDGGHLLAHIKASHPLRMLPSSPDLILVLTACTNVELRLSG